MKSRYGAAIRERKKITETEEKRTFVQMELALDDDWDKKEDSRIIPPEKKPAIISSLPKSTTETNNENDAHEQEGYEKCFFTDEEKEDVARENDKLVYYMANKFRSTGVDIDELSSAGMLGYAKAINTYDKKRNVKFSTYALNCIRNEILFFLRKENKHRAKNISMSTTLSTDQNGNPFELEDIIQDEEEGMVSDNIFDIERQEILKEAISRLTPREQYIIMYRYGLVDGQKRTQKVISEQIRMSQANVSKLQKTSLEKLQRHLREISGNRQLSFEEALEL